MNHYVLKLTDEHADSRSPDRIMYYVVETEKQKEEVEKVYEDACREWEEDETDSFDCKISHVEMRLREQGMEMFPLEVDLELDF